MKAPFVLATACIALFVSARVAEAGILQKWDFDSPNPLHNLVIQGDKPEIIPDPKQPGNHVMRSVLRPGAKRAERSEVMPGVIQCGEERWVGVRILRPDRTQSGFNCFSQLGPVDGAPGHGGGGLYQLNCYNTSTWAFRAFMERMGGKGIHQDVGAIHFGDWENWAFHIKVSDKNDGLIEVWRNGTPVLKHAGPNVYPGDKVRIKWGVYVGKGGKVPGEISALYDDIIIGDAKSNLQEVSAKRHGAGGIPSRL